MTTMATLITSACTAVAAYASSPWTQLLGRGGDDQAADQAPRLARHSLAAEGDQSCSSTRARTRRTCGCGGTATICAGSD